MKATVTYYLERAARQFGARLLTAQEMGLCMFGMDPEQRLFQIMDPHSGLPAPEVVCYFALGESVAACTFDPSETEAARTGEKVAFALKALLECEAGRRQEIAELERLAKL